MRLCVVASHNHRSVVAGGTRGGITLRWRADAEEGIAFERLVSELFDLTSLLQLTSLFLGHWNYRDEKRFVEEWLRLRCEQRQKLYHLERPRCEQSASNHSTDKINPW